MAQREHPAVTTFREYVRIKTVHPDPDYEACSKFLQRQGEELGAKVHVMECVPGKPIIIMTVEGRDPTLPSLLLNSHTDVVPVFPEHWKYDPFSGHKDENGEIYGRGTQDMKSVGMQYLEALKQLRSEGNTFLRTVHVSFVPEEETGGAGGMQSFAETDYFRKMNVGVALDEGYASTSEDFLFFYGQRQTYNLYVRCTGQPGHASQFLPNTAGEKLRKMINSFLSFRDQEERRLTENPDLQLGDVTTVNLTMLEGGVQFNVVPAQLSVGFDIRFPPTVDPADLESMVQGWCTEAGEDVVFEVYDKSISSELSCAVDGESSWWDAFSQACKKEKITVKKQIFPASTDGRILRKLGIPAFGFSPMNNTERLLHDHNERLNEKMFLRGIQIYASIISALANCTP